MLREAPRIGSRVDLDRRDPIKRAPKERTRSTRIDANGTIRLAGSNGPFVEHYCSSKAGKSGRAVDQRIGRERVRWPKRVNAHTRSTERGTTKGSYKDGSSLEYRDMVDGTIGDVEEDSSAWVAGRAKRARWV